MSDEKEDNETGGYFDKFVDAAIANETSKKLTGTVSEDAEHPYKRYMRLHHERPAGRTYYGVKK
jgi:hypothetical protein